MKLKTLALASLMLLALPSLASATPLPFPGPAAVDSSTGATVTSGVTAAVASVTDIDGNALSTSLATAHVANGNTSAVYDGVNGNAWVTETLTATGHTFNPVVIFCSTDPSTLVSTNAAALLLQAGLVPITGVVSDSNSTTTVVDATLSSGTSVDPSGDGFVVTSGPYKGKVTHVLSYNSSTNQVTVVSPFVAALASGTTFACIPYNKALVLALAALGTDNRPILSANTQPALSLSTGDETSLGYLAGMNTILGKFTFDSGSILNVDANAAMKADPLISNTLTHVLGKYTYGVTTHVMSILNDSGTALLDPVTHQPITVTIGYDPTTGTITSKQ